MASEIVRNIRNVTSIDNMNLDITEENDLVSDQEGNVYIRLKDKYEKLVGMTEDEQKIQQMIDDINTEIEKLKSSDTTSNKKVNALNNQVQELNTALENMTDFTPQINELNNKIDSIEIPNYDEKFSEYDITIQKINRKSDDALSYVNSLKNGTLKTEVLKDIDLQNKKSLESVPIGVHYINGKNNIPEMATYNGWLTIRDTGIVRSIEFQPYNHAKVFRTQIYQDKLGEWEWTLTNK